MKHIKTKSLVKILKGTHTIATIMNLLGVNKQKAVYYIYKLRKEGYIKTRRLSNNKRLYYISLQNKFGGRSYTAILNENSPIKLAESETYIIYDREPSLEEVLVYAVKSKQIRIILSSLWLFKKIKNWKRLYNLAKQNNILRQICALYDLARTLFKTRRIKQRFITLCNPKKKDMFLYIIPEMKSKDYKSIEKRWRVYIPFNNVDFEEYLKNDKH